MPFSDYSQRMAQNQVDLVRRFNRVVTQRIGAGLVDLAAPPRKTVF
jgi:hypothetical protein